MANTQSTQTTLIAEAINIVSGAYAAPLVDALFELCAEDDSLQGIYHAINALGEEGRTIEAVQLIRAMLDIANIQYSETIAQLEENESKREMFVKEFIADLTDILYGE
ncbi:MAG: hypothetical protein LBD02_08820 [Christensenellaceae bacterium]|jgi:hypothetical protein|nr:hypothetical protein [Christensenellaceae bacterium]